MPEPRAAADPHPSLPSAPLVPLALAVALGVVTDRYCVDWGTRSWAMLALGMAIVALFSARRARVLVTVGLVLAWAAIGGAWHHLRWFDLPPSDLARRLGESAPPRLAWLTGVVDDVPSFRPGTGASESGTTRAVLEVSALSDGQRWHPASGRVQLVISGDRTDLRAGTFVQAAGSLAAIAGPLNPGEFDYRELLRAQGIRLRLSITDPQGVWRDVDHRPPAGVLAALRRGSARWLGTARQWSYNRLVAGIDPSIAPLAAALLLGRREGVEPEVNDAFARTGTMHLLAISGAHLQVLAGLLWLVFRTVGLSRRRSYLAVAVATLSYALLVGLVPSVVRSAAMTVTICLGAMRDRLTRPANTLALAALVVMALNPAHLFDVGCQLSFLAVAAIAWAIAPAVGLFRWLRTRLWLADLARETPLDTLERRLAPLWLKLFRHAMVMLWQGLVVSVVVWLVTLPLVALRFHLVSPIGILLNVPLIPLTSLALLAAGLTLVASAFWAPLAMPLARLCTWLLDASERVVLWGSAQRWGHGFVAGPPSLWVLAFYVGLALALLAWAARWWGWRLAWVGLCAWFALGGYWALPPRRPGALEADVLAVGHGLAVVIQNAEGHAMVYDCGRLGDPSVGRRLIAPALWARGVHRLDAVVMSHADADHYNGLPDLLDRFQVDSILIGYDFDRAANPGAKRLLELVKARGIPVHRVAAGACWAFGRDATCEVLHPPQGWFPQAPDNEHSLVLDLASQGHRFLLTGDLEQEGQAALRKQVSRDFDTVLAPHHGGRTASLPWLYDWARPQNAVVSQRRPAVNARNYLAFLPARGIPVLHTWRDGAARLQWTESGIAVHGFLEETRVGSSPSERLAPVLIRIVRPVLVVIGLLLGLALCLLVAAVEWGAWILVRPGRRLKARPSEPAGWEPVEITAAEGILLRGGWLPGTSPGRCAIVLHGFAEDREAVRNRAEALAQAGWSVALPDARGHGQSDGHHASFGGREADDLQLWLDALNSRTDPDACWIAWGHSMGAAVALRAASDDPRIKALVLEAPYPDLEAAVAAWIGRLRVPGHLAALIVRRAAALAGVSLTRPRPIDLASSVDAPTLILHGSDDPIIPPAEARRLAEAFPSPATVIDVAGARHNDVVELGGQPVVKQVVAFLERSLGQAGCGND